MNYSLFDKLGQHIAKTKAPTNMTGMKFTHSLIKHLDQL